ncbi:sigma-70 RNA polymerase sigma factor region 4 domain-containing protein [Enterococcus sp. LJL120]
MDYNQTLLQAEKMLKGILSRLLIFETHPEYDDYLQILRLNLYDWLQANPEKDFEQWQGFLFQRFTWDIQTLRRNHWRRQLREKSLTEYEETTGWSFEEICELKDVLTLKTAFTERERIYIELRLAGYSQREIAAFWQVSTTVVSRLKIKICRKLKKILA